MHNSGKKIAVLSGKGGTGKTLVSVNLAAAAGKSLYIDCDVEEPNGHLFFKPEETIEEAVTVKMPAVDENLCSGCRKCVDFCAFNALAFIKGQPMLFEDVCHSCGGCMLVCPEKAMTETLRAIGTIKEGVSGSVTVRTGILNIGEASGVPIIKKLLENSCLELPVFIDCPPGSACIVMDSIRQADYCIIVAEPTIFGVHNLNMVFELVKLMNKPFGAVLNKCLDGNNPAEEFCRANNIPILAKLSYDAELGELNSEAKIAVRESCVFGTLFSSILDTVMKEASHEKASYTER